MSLFCRKTNKLLFFNRLQISIDNMLQEKYILSVKLKYSSYLIIILAAAFIYAGTFLEYFQGRSEGEDIRLEWKTREEVNLQQFNIERKTPHNSFVEIATVQPKGSNSFYTYLDKSAYKPTDMIFIYRLKIVNTNGQISYSSEVTVSHSVSGVKRTWGSIKAMFR